jgi:hypothetical protein
VRFGAIEQVKRDVIVTGTFRNAAIASLRDNSADPSGERDNDKRKRMATKIRADRAQISRAVTRADLV